MTAAKTEPGDRPNWDAVDSLRAVPIEDAVLLSLDCDPGALRDDVLERQVEYPLASVVAQPPGVDPYDADPDGIEQPNLGPAEVSYEFVGSKRHPGLLDWARGGFVPRCDAGSVVGIEAASSFVHRMILAAGDGDVGALADLADWPRTGRPRVMRPCRLA